MNKTIEIIVTPDGQSRVETKGFTGSECRQASQFIEQALGQRTSEQLTAEFHQSVQQNQQINN
ncbi:DUF2997 domain-containing protein [Rubinisphaera sp.]|uniref:DUF2997 domain-containing protein n=1 Tax=Rubinisphaera sp. TaxID=2024857 RepID=UPI000C10CD9A|nr:DUF2997 domain-containing protein [Rubinisphaera sp.]MBV09480.1 hypothetical protein [Rubinisphaera sp.]HCS52208.1 hypothetical protein [Planctomycetaceae bacterium]